MNRLATAAGNSPTMRLVTRMVLGAHLNTSTLPLVDSLSPRLRGGERVRERGFQLAAPIRWKVPLSPAPLPARASQGEGAGGFHDGGPIQMRTGAGANTVFTFSKKQSGSELCNPLQNRKVISL